MFSNRFFFWFFHLNLFNYYLTIFLRPYASRERGIEDEKPEKYRKELTVNTARAKKTTKIPTEYHKFFSRFGCCCFSIKISFRRRRAKNKYRNYSDTLKRFACFLGDTRDGTHNNRLKVTFKQKYSVWQSRDSSKQKEDCSFFS